MYCFAWGGIGISTFHPEPTPYSGQGYTIWYKYHTVSQLNKIRILFNSLPLHTHIYPYTTVYHCIPCIHRTAYPIHLPLKQDYYTIYKRVQARIRTTVYIGVSCYCTIMPEKNADIGRSSTRLIWYKPQFFYPLYHFTTLQLYHFTQQKRFHNG